MKRKAVINPKTGIVENVIVAGDDFVLEGKLLKGVEEFGIGDTYDGEKFIRKPQPEPQPEEKTKAELLEERLAALEVELLKLKTPLKEGETKQ